jgi:hypothetical protein
MDLQSASKKIGYKFSDRLIANLMELEVILHPQLQLDFTFNELGLRVK